MKFYWVEELLRHKLDALDEQAVEKHLDDVISKGGKIDISFNAIGLSQKGVQNIPLTQLSVEIFSFPINLYKT